MKMKTLRKLQNLAPRTRKRAKTDFDFSDATREEEPGPLPEAVFDRITGPYGSRFILGYDEET